MAMMARVFRLGARSRTNRSLWSISLEVESSSCWGSKASCSGVKYRGGPEYGEVPPNRKIRLPTLVIACLRLGLDQLHTAPLLPRPRTLCPATKGHSYAP